MEKINLKEIINSGGLYELEKKFDSKQDYFSYLDQKKEFFFDNLETEYSIKIDQFQYNHYNRLKSYDDIVDTIFNMLNVECSALNMFRYINDPKIITCFLFFNQSPIIFDEIMLFNENSFAYKFMQKNGFEKTSSFIHQIMLDVSKRILQIEKDCVVEEEEINNISDIEEEEVNLIPKNINEAVESLLITSDNTEIFYSNLNKLHDKINFNESISVEIMTNIMFNAIFSIIYVGWYFDYEDSPLRVWFKENRNETNEFKMIYEIINLFSANLILKHKDL